MTRVFQLPVHAQTIARPTSPSCCCSPSGSAPPRCSPPRSIASCFTRSTSRIRRRSCAPSSAILPSLTRSGFPTASTTRCAPCTRCAIGRRGGQLRRRSLLAQRSARRCPPHPRPDGLRQLLLHARHQAATSDAPLALQTSTPAPPACRSSSAIASGRAPSPTRGQSWAPRSPSRASHS